jgi:2-oxoglutarate ferredoxin oxidoreductase subunit gamma
MFEECLFAGFGGQGVLMMGRLLAQAALEQGLNATWLPSYGPEMRGGTANCIVVFSDDEVGSPVAASFDVVVAMNQPSLEKFEPKVKPGGTLLVNSSIVPIRSSRTDIDAYYVEANDLAESVAGSNKAANVVAMGALHGLRPRLKTASFEKALGSVFAKKGGQIVDGNIRALHAGMDAVASLART